MYIFIFTIGLLFCRKLSLSCCYSLLSTHIFLDLDISINQLVHVLGSVPASTSAQMFVCTRMVTGNGLWATWLLEVQLVLRLLGNLLCFFTSVCALGNLFTINLTFVLPNGLEGSLTTCTEKDQLLFMHSSHL